jgi:hypothetical protein
LVDDADLEQDTIRYHGFSYSGLQNLSVLTTADMPFQKRDDFTLHTLLPKACLSLTGKNLPVELVTHIMESRHLGLSREMAEHHRRQLMQERRVIVLRITPTSGVNNEALERSLRAHIKTIMGDAFPTLRRVELDVWNLQLVS